MCRTGLEGMNLVMSPTGCRCRNRRRGRTAMSEKSDLISREPLKICKHSNGYGYCSLYDQYCAEGPCKSEALIEYVPVVHGSPVYHNRPARYEHYEMVQQTENGEPLYKRQYYTLQDNPVAYCSECGKRMCSRFTSFCPNCGAKMDGKEDGADHE